MSPNWQVAKPDPHPSPTDREIVRKDAIREEYVPGERRGEKFRGVFNVGLVECHSPLHRQLRVRGYFAESVYAF